MLRRRLSAAATAAVLVLSACAGADGTESGPIRENVIEPGITAIDDAPVAACGAEASSFRTALEAYEVLEGEPAADEQALIDAGLLRNESELWDIVDGELVAQDPACGDVPTTVPTADIVTEEGASRASTVDELLTTLNPDDIKLVGGPDCARQLAVVFVGEATYLENEEVEPETLEQVVASGYLSEPLTMWMVVDGTLRPTTDSTCRDFVAESEAQQAVRRCRVEAQTLETAAEAYVGVFGEVPTVQNLVDENYLSDPGPDIAFDLVDGEPVPVAGGDCDGLDVDQPPVMPTEDDCAAERRTFEVAIEAYVAQSGALPPSEQELVAGGLIRKLFVHHDLAADGTVVLAPDGDC